MQQQQQQPPPQPAAAAAGHPDPATARALESLETMTLGVLDSLQKIQEATTEFSESEQPRIYGELQSFTQQLKEMQDHQLPDSLGVPFGALDYMDKAANPDLFWRDILQETTAAVDTNRGRALTLQALQSNLAAELASLTRNELPRVRPLPVNPNTFKQPPLVISMETTDSDGRAGGSETAGGAAAAGGGPGLAGGSVSSIPLVSRLDPPNPGETPEWVGCDTCKKYRRLPFWVKADSLGEVWHCNNNSWNPLEAKCTVMEELETWKTDGMIGMIG